MEIGAKNVQNLVFWVIMIIFLKVNVHLEFNICSLYLVDFERQISAEWVFLEPTRTIWEHC